MTTTEQKNDTRQLTLLSEQYFQDEPEEGTSYEVSHEIKIDTESYILCWTGRRGAGKTTDMTYFTAKGMALFNKRVLANYPIEFMYRRFDGRSYPLKSEPLDLYKLLAFDSDYHDCLIVLDEAPDIISHMAAMTWKNRLLNIFIRQLRKNRNSLFLAAQDFGLIDKSMRWQVDVIVECEDAYRKYGAGFEKGSTILERWKDNSGTWTGSTWQEELKRANARGLYFDGSWCEDLELIAKPMWGTPGVTRPVFDSYFQQDVWESLRKVDMKLTSYKVGDGQQQEAQQDVQGGNSPFELARGLIDAIKQESSGLVTSPHFYESIPDLTPQMKLKLGKAITHLPGLVKKKVGNGWTFDFSGVNSYDLEEK
jgi:hypothetical protein